MLQCTRKILLIIERNLSEMSIFNKLFGTYSEKQIKKIDPIVDKIESLDKEYSALTDKQLRAKTDEFKNRLKNG